MKNIKKVVIIFLAAVLTLPIQCMEQGTQARQRVYTIFFNIPEGQQVPFFAERISVVMHDSVEYNARMLIGGDEAVIGNIKWPQDIRFMQSTCKQHGVSIYIPKKMNKALQAVPQTTVYTI